MSLSFIQVSLLVHLSSATQASGVGWCKSRISFTHSRLILSEINLSFFWPVGDGLRRRPASAD
jgi:hypothetical protein